MSENLYASLCGNDACAIHSGGSRRFACGIGAVMTIIMKRVAYYMLSFEAVFCMALVAAYFLKG